MVALDWAVTFHHQDILLKTGVEPGFGKWSVVEQEVWEAQPPEDNYSYLNFNTEFFEFLLAISTFFSCGNI